MFIDIIDLIGDKVLSACRSVGNFSVFCFMALRTLLTTKLKVHHMLCSMQSIGVDSLIIIGLTGSFTGLAIAFQSYIGFHRVGAEEFIGMVVTLGMARELGPVLTGLMVTGRSGSSMAAEIGTMQITEQVDALRTLCIDPFRYLIVPRIVAATIILPFLTIFSVMCGIAGGYLFCVYELGISPDIFISTIRERVELFDITGGLIKASAFGLIFSLVGTYQGYKARGGARGVGIATTSSVVIGSIAILIANFFLNSFLFQASVP
jgi:phospholipid/cholesterol/gamma-HCH transport system permease protein